MERDGSFLPDFEVCHSKFSDLAGASAWTKKIPFFPGIRRSSQYPPFKPKRSSLRGVGFFGPADSAPASPLILLLRLGSGEIDVRLLSSR